MQVLAEHIAHTAAEVLVKPGVITEDNLANEETFTKAITPGLTQATTELMGTEFEKLNRMYEYLETWGFNDFINISKTLDTNLQGTLCSSIVQQLLILDLLRAAATQVQRLLCQ